jgi:hypothetical protein
LRGARVEFRRLCDHRCQAHARRAFQGTVIRNSEYVPPFTLCRFDHTCDTARGEFSE